MSSHLLQCTKVPYSDGTLSIYPNCGYRFDFMGPGYLTYGNLRLLPYYKCAIHFVLLSSGSIGHPKEPFPVFFPPPPSPHVRHDKSTKPRRTEVI